MPRCEDIGYEDDSQEDMEEQDLLEDIERLLERKLEELFSRMQNSSKQLLTSMRMLLLTIRDGTLDQQSPKDQETIKESETTL